MIELGQRGLGFTTTCDLFRRAPQFLMPATCSVLFRLVPSRAAVFDACYLFRRAPQFLMRVPMPATCSVLFRPTPQILMPAT
jgi:hypothetical protein